MDGFLCARPGCALPLFVSACSDDDPRLRLWHVHATTPTEKPDHVILNLKAAGRGGCEAPLTLAPGTPCAHLEPVDEPGPTRL